MERDTIVEALGRLNDRLATKGVRAELFLVGGAVMCLVHYARPSTKDVDGWFSEPQAMRSAARLVAEEMGLPEDWLNDAAKGFVPQNANYESWASLSNLSVSTIDTRTLLAMKVVAARTEEDAADIRFLVQKLHLSSAAQILDLALEYFPANRIPVRSQLLLEEMFP